KYPVRDPFFLMIRRSLNTFMNAFTSSDYTAYPFASQNRKDFNNLLGIYLDAVFFPRLDPLDFAQEGHRIELENPDDPDSPLVYKGVVFNEMKGDTSSPVSVLYDGIKAALFEHSTYHHNSGGDPEVIPQLTYQGLLDFYRTHYHPSNAVFMTYGDIPAAELQASLESLALHRFDRLDEKIAVVPEPRFSEPRRAEIEYAVDEDDGRKSHVVMGWLLGENTDLEMLLKCNLMSDVLLDTSASPLRKALETSDLGAAASPLCGLEESNFEMSFFCGLEGCEADSAEAIEALVLETLQQVAEEGVPVDSLEACVHQLELNQREIGGDGYPYGLQLMFSCMSAAIHNGDPIGLLDLNHVVSKIRSEMQDPAFMGNLIRELLLDNSHRVTLTMKPDTRFAEKQRQRETDRLAALKAQMTRQDIDALLEKSRELNERQAQPEPLEVLPKVGLEDISDSLANPQGTSKTLKAGPRLTTYDAGTNGLSYHQIVCALPALDEELTGVLPLYSSLVTEIG
ncbi:MAG: insulinase family protein, partial [Pseudomonadales bacterium]|nr:insulinase family protein [Pseudomonadales bacterium]